MTARFRTWFLDRQRGAAIKALPADAILVCATAEDAEAFAECARKAGRADVEVRTLAEWGARIASTAQRYRVGRIVDALPPEYRAQPCDTQINYVRQAIARMEAAEDARDLGDIACGGL